MKNDYFVELVEFVKNNIVLPGDVVYSVWNNVLTLKCEGVGSWKIEYLKGVMFRLVLIEEFPFEGEDLEIDSVIVPFNKLVKDLQVEIGNVFEMLQ